MNSKLKKYFFIILLFLPGVVYYLFKMGLHGARDLRNIFRFPVARIGPGACIDEVSTLDKNIAVGDGTYILNSIIGNYSYIGSRCIIQNSRIGKFCSIANDVMIGLGSHPLNGFSTSPIFYKKNNILRVSAIAKNIYFKEYEEIIIGNDVWIGAKSIIKDGVTIGDGAVIAAGAVVIKDVEPYAVVAGVPAKVIKMRLDQAMREKVAKSNWWDFSLNEIPDKF